MPSATQKALSMSMADLNFDPAPHKRRAQQNRTKRDMSQSCSAFNFVLDPRELGREEANKTRSKAKGSGSKPSYSDLIMDATSKTAATAVPAGSPTSVIEEEEVNEHSLEEEEPTTIPETKTATSSRMIPSNDDFNRSRNRSGNTTKSSTATSSRSSHSEASADPTTPGARARRNRKARSGSGKFSKSCHMSFADFGAQEEEEFEVADFSAGPAPRSPRSKGSSANERFSKSFSDFGDWDKQNNSTTPRRGRKKPVTRTKSNEEYSQPTDEAPEDFNNSFSEMDLFPNKTNTTPKRSSSGTSKLKPQRSFSFGEWNFSQHKLELEPTKEGTTAPTRQRRRRSSVDHNSNEGEEVTTTTKRPLRKTRSKPKEGTSKMPGLRRSNTTDGSGPIRPRGEGARRARGSSTKRSPRGSSVDPSNKEAARRRRRSSVSLSGEMEENDTTASPSNLDSSGRVRSKAERTKSRGSNTKRSPRGSSKEPSSPRRRRRSSVSLSGGEMEDNDAAASPNNLDSSGRVRSKAERRKSRGSSTKRRSSLADSHGDNIIDSPRRGGGGPRRTKSGDMMRSMRDRSSATPTTRRTPRRTKSSDGSTMSFSRVSKQGRSTSMGHGSEAGTSMMNQSMSHFSEAPPSTRAAPRRKTPGRSKSHDGSGAIFARRTTSNRDRERVDKELRGSSTRDHHHDLRGSGSRHNSEKPSRKSDKEMRHSRGADNAVNRRAQAHLILKA